MRGLKCCLAIGMVVAVCGVAAAQSGSEQIINERNGTAQLAPKGDAAMSAQAVMEYWTAERMAEAQPMPIPTAVVTDTGASTVVARPSLGTPGAVDGHTPGGGPFVPKVHEFKASEQQAAMAAPQAFGTAPTDPLNGPYGPFQRWTMEANYLTWPRSVHGKLFFSLNGGNWVCSATAINRSTIATAGHCISDGAGNFGSNWLFCPSYITTGVNPAVGCWAGNGGATTSSAWHFSGEPDYDYACVVTAVTGTVVANKLGNVTGWAGRAWNWGSNMMTTTFGYPAEAPFNGTIIEETVSPEWYDWDPVAGGQVSKVIGSDLTGGASGGGWILGWRHPNAEVADTDGNSYTDGGVANLWLNGVNSHKRCRTACTTPPTATQGIFWQEMTSPPFVNTASGGESEDVFAGCFASANNN